MATAKDMLQLAIYGLVLSEAFSKIIVKPSQFTKCRPLAGPGAAWLSATILFCVAVVCASCIAFTSSVLRPQEEGHGNMGVAFWGSVSFGCLLCGVTLGLVTISQFVAHVRSLTFSPSPGPRP